MSAPMTLDAAERAFPRAAHLAVYDGRTRLGTILDTREPAPRSPSAPSYAFDLEGVLVGTFSDRKQAAAALSGGGG